MHTMLRIDMGERFVEPDENNPLGYWEDLDFVELNSRLLSGDIHLVRFMRLLELLIRKKSQKGATWGIKDPRISDLLGIYLVAIDNPRIIVAARSARMVIYSIARCSKISLNRAYALYRRRKLALDRIVKYVDYLVIGFDSHVEDQQIADRITAKWKPL